MLSIHALHPGTAIPFSNIPGRSMCIHILINYCNERSFYERVVLGVGRHIGFAESFKKTSL